MSNDEGMTNHPLRDTSFSTFVIRASTLIRHSSFGFRHLIDIALVTLVALELLNVFIGLINGFTALLLHDLAQCRIDILRHSLRVAAHKKVGALAVEPFPNFSCIVVHLMLDINLLGLIA